ncbi:Na+-transporting methylmalonyl-CoA/oxaloacetate decarboxylase, gamma subunit [Lachnospiraceae bacterium RM5]|nr:Na+-transporting methylmalonyl-CoA/oxaloacetate decarboxylase, gamma subunit [Lachnospiraceae bacterium RM5]
MKNIKKISILICIMSCMFLLCSCGASKKNELKLKYDKASLVEVARNFVESSASVTNKDLLEQVDNYTGADKDIYINAVNGFVDTRKENGAYVGFYADKDDTPLSKIEADDKEVLLTVYAQFKKRDVNIVLTFEPDETIGDSGISNYEAYGSFRVTNIRYDVQYSFVEKMKKAGLNTLLGIGTVFVILILLSFIISLFKYVDSIARGLGNIKNIFKKKEKNIEVKDKSEKQSGSDSDEDMDYEESDEEDEGELVAVIAAAISAYTGKPQDGFYVRNIRRVQKTSGWK